MFKNNFEDYVINKQFNSLENKLKGINVIVEDINDGQKNDRYSIIISAVTDIEQSMLEDDEKRKIFIQLMAQSKLNLGVDSVLREFIGLVSFFVEWNEKNFIEKNFGSIKYSEKNVEKNLNQLCDDYVYLKKGIKTLIDLKISQGIETEKLQYLISQLNNLDLLIEENKIYNWLAPENEINSWQHQLLYGEKYISHILQKNEDFNENKFTNDRLDDIEINKSNFIISEYKEKIKKIIQNILK